MHSLTISWLYFWCWQWKQNGIMRCSSGTWGGSQTPVLCMMAYGEATASAFLFFFFLCWKEHDNIRLIDYVEEIADICAGPVPSIQQTMEISTNELLLSHCTTAMHGLSLPHSYGRCMKLLSSLHVVYFMCDIVTNVEYLSCREKCTVSRNGQVIHTSQY